MLKHLKTRGQAMGVAQSKLEGQPNHTKAEETSPGHVKVTGSWRLPELGVQQQQQQQQNEKPRRVRGRRSSKPMMEKRRRARINECLDILKSYVLGDSSNLSQFGVDVAALSENQDEETIARTILKSSGLINRHRGRKNPNKLEKADILELTVDYVRRLHDQRDQAKWPRTTTTSSLGGLHPVGSLKPPAEVINNNSSSLPLGKPLTLSLPPVAAGLQATAPPSPPPSSASNSPQPLLSILGTNLQHNINTNIIDHPPVDALDLSDSRRARVRQTEQQQHQSQSQASYQEELAKHTNNRWHTINGNGLLLVEGADGCWRPWNLAGGQSI